MFSALRYRDFRFALMTLILSQAGYWGCNIAFQSVVSDLDGTPATMGVLFFCLLVPFTLFSIPAGVLADAYDRQRLQIAILLVISVLAAACMTAIATRTTDLPVLFALAFLAGTGISFLSPVTQALVANTVPVGVLGSAVPLQAAGLNLARSIGPAVAGVILVLWGPIGPFGMYAALTLTAAGTAFAVRTRSAPGLGATRPRDGVLAQVSAGIRHARERPPAGLCLTLVGISAFFGCAFTTQLAILTAGVSPDPEAVFPTLIALTGVGSFLGVLIVARLGTRVLTIGHAAAALGILGACNALLGASPNVPILGAASLLCGAFSIGMMVILQTVLQRVIDDAQRGRVMSLYFLSWGAMPFGALLLGALSTRAGSTTAFSLYAGACLVGGVAVLWRLRRRPTGH